MTEAAHPEPSKRLDSAEQAQLREMARDLGIPLYHRFTATEAADHLGISAGELEELRAQGRIAYLQISGKHISFFGIQLLTYLRECIVPIGAQPSVTEPEEQPAQPAVNPDAELVSVKDAITLLGIGRTKLYELINSREIDSVKIGTRTLIKQASIRRLTGTDSE